MPISNSLTPQAEAQAKKVPAKTATARELYSAAWHAGSKAERGKWLPMDLGRFTLQAWATVMTAIALAESGGAMHKTNSYVSDGQTHTVYGPWQISDIHTDCHKGDHRRLQTDLQFSADVAVCVYNKQGLTAWSVYKSGAHKAHIKTAEKQQGNVLDKVAGKLTGTYDEGGRASEIGIDWGQILLVAGGAIAILFGVIFLATKVL